MFCTKFLNIIREYELGYLKQNLNKSAKILEIGGGTGIQAKLLSEAGLNIESIDLKNSTYSEERVYPVVDYDGQTIPFNDNEFDIVFSSNVLEHIQELDDFEKEIKRVLKPGGECVHVMPTGAWRFWTSVAHYIEFFQRSFILMYSDVLKNFSISKLRPFASNFVGLLRAYKKPPRHGEHGTTWTEVYLFSKIHWLKHFQKNDFLVNQAKPMGLFYTGHMVLGKRIPLKMRKYISYVLGSACVLYKVTPVEITAKVGKSTFELMNYANKVKRKCEADGLKKIGLILPIEANEVIAECVEMLPINIIWTTDKKKPSVIPEKIKWRCYDSVKNRWNMPKVMIGTPVFYYGYTNTISFYMACSAFLSGVYKIYSISGSRLIKNYSYKILLQRIKDKTSCEVQHFQRKVGNKSRNMNIMPTPSPVNSANINKSSKLQRKQYSSLVDVFKEIESSIITKNTSNMKIVINHSLAWGGAERQLVNMVTGMVHEYHQDIMVVCEDLTSDPHYEFYLWQLEQKKINITELDKSKECFSDDNSGIDKILEIFPEYIQNDIWAFYLLFKEKKPSVVHAWQDSTSIKAAVAALAAGVPNIIMCTRNIAPENFAYIQPYMKPAYQALLERDTVRMINNSIAGAKDYERWLGLKKNTIDIIYNGFDVSRIDNVTDESIKHYKEQLKIPEKSTVVGSIFRLYPEKDPILWIQTIAEIAKYKNDIYFLLVGVGPMLNEVRDEAERLNVIEKLILPGTEKHPGLPLSLMDVFLLTSKMEGTPNVIIEAQWMRVPVVATDAGGSKEAFIDGKTGYLSPLRDPILLSEMVINILENKEWLNRSKVTSREFIGSRFGKRRMVEEYLNCYKTSVTIDAASHAGEELSLL